MPRVLRLGTSQYLSESYRESRRTLPPTFFEEANGADFVEAFRREFERLYPTWRQRHDDDEAFVAKLAEAIAHNRLRIVEIAPSTEGTSPSG